MSRLTPLPAEFTTRPFHRRELIAAGHSADLLRSARFERLLPGVWMHRDHQLTHADRIDAALLATTDRAKLSHVSRIQHLGLDIGAHLPVHLTVAGDLHLDLPGVFVHRTERIPEYEGRLLRPAVAFIQCCASMPLIQLIVIGDWLLQHGHASVEEILTIAHRERWRPGAPEAMRVVPELDGRSRSPRESQVRVWSSHSGLPPAEVNYEVVVNGKLLAILDLCYLRWRLAAEYEGGQHFGDRVQWSRDIDRYALLRELDIAYVQISSSLAANPVAAVQAIHKALVRRGYDGPPPTFGPRWAELFQPIFLSSPGSGADAR